MKVVMRSPLKHVVLFATLTVLAAIPAYAVHITSVDQSNTADVVSGTPNIVGDGQSFTPTFASMNAVDLAFVDIGGAVGATVQIRIRFGSIAGAILGTSDALILPDGFGFSGASGAIPDDDVASFFFSTPVALTPGALHVIEFLHLAGDPIAWRGTNGNTYPGGTAIFDGNPSSGQDGWFRTGNATVPEPSSLALLTVGIAILAARRRSNA